MSVLIIILLTLASLVVLFLLVAFLVKKDFTLQKEIVINQPKSAVFEFVRLIRNQEEYSVWVMKDPKIRIVYTGIDGTPGFTSSWESDDKNVGIGEQEIKKIREGESMEVEIRFKKPFEATNYSLTTLSASGDSQTKLTNLFYGRSKYPMNIMNLFMDKLVGKDMAQNLANLKKILESK